jgi:hypothetical protein
VSAMELRAFRRGVAVAAAVGLVAAGHAQAGTNRISDGNDRPGPLDIRSASHGHAGVRVVHTISTFALWRAGLLGPGTPNLFAVEISTDGDAALERVVLIFSANGRMVARVYRLSGGRLVLVGPATASKPNGRTVRVSIARSQLGSPAGYRWKAHSQYRAAGACSNFCIDKAPNSRRVLHDITPPAIALASSSFPAIAPDIEYDVSFGVSDAGGAGLRRWDLQHRAVGTSTWTTVLSGTTVGAKSFHQMSAEDDDDEFRVVAVDRHGNTRISAARSVSVPIDNAPSTALVYTGAWAHGTGDPSDFRGTLSTSSTPTDTVTFTFTGQYVAWVAPGGGDGDALVSTDEPGTESVLLGDFSGRRQIVFEHTFASAGSHTIEIEVAGGTVPIDGFIVR